MVPEFANEPLTDFVRSAPDRQAMETALREVKGEFAREWPLIIGGERVTTTVWIDSRNPCQKDQVVGRTAKAGQGEAQRALDAAWNAFADWSTWQPDQRARLLLKAAALLRRRKHLFSATMVYEAGKTWPEADGDTAEAIDFLEYYAREDNELMYLSLGVGIVIPPWNFPLAITLGMTAAAIVTGNTAILKPASLTPIIAARAVDLLSEAGVPSGVVNFLPGSGGQIGDFLVAHPK